MGFCVVLLLTQLPHSRVLGIPPTNQSGRGRKSAGWQHLDSPTSASISKPQQPPPTCHNEHKHKTPSPPTLPFLYNHIFFFPLTTFWMSFFIRTAKLTARPNRLPLQTIIRSRHFSQTNRIMGVHNLANKGEFDAALANNKVVVLDAYVSLQSLNSSKEGN